MMFTRKVIKIREFYIICARKMTCRLYPLIFGALSVVLNIWVFFLGFPLIKYGLNIKSPVATLTTFLRSYSVHIVVLRGTTDFAPR